MTPNHLEERLIDFVVKIISVTNSIPKTTAGNHLSRQLCRSGISPALNYGEAQSAESLDDFIHKMRICLKELRESHVAIKIILRAKLNQNDELTFLYKECNELISIFVTSIKTARERKTSLS
ncbi:MAG TPA: four helix bundle protein [Bacteroidia bacterium]|nr:four helix bundle protein [Bacteroidia bacterium]